MRLPGFEPKGLKQRVWEERPEAQERHCEDKAAAQCSIVNWNILESEQNDMKHNGYLSTNIITHSLP